MAKGDFLTNKDLTFHSELESALTSGKYRCVIVSSLTETLVVIPQHAGEASDMVKAMKLALGSAIAYLTKMLPSTQVTHKPLRNQGGNLQAELTIDNIRYVCEFTISQSLEFGSYKISMRPNPFPVEKKYSLKVNLAMFIYCEMLLNALEA